MIRLALTAALLLLAASRPHPYGDATTLNAGVRFAALDCGIEYRPGPVAWFCHVD